MKTFKKIVISFLLSFALIPSVIAAEIGSIKGTYSYDNIPFNDTKVYLYKIANMNEQDKFIYLDSYLNFELDINTLGSTEWQNYANTLYNYIKSNSIVYNDLINTDATGNYIFKNLNKGLYLLIFEDISKNGSIYTSSPTLISIPNRDDITGAYTYDITVNSKVEEEKIEEVPKPTTTEAITTAPNIIDVPQTSDNIMIYIVLFIVSLLILLIIGCYIFKLKKENEVNENNEEKQ